MTEDLDSANEGLPVPLVLLEGMEIGRTATKDWGSGKHTGKVQHLVTKDDLNSS